MGAVTIDEAMLDRLIPAFYERVREDSELAPVFNDAVEDWPAHLEKLVAFWSSVMLTTGRYKGSPVMAHLRHKERITPQLFDRWLALWCAVTTEVVPPEIAAMLQAKAARIAESLQLALFFKFDPPGGDRAAVPASGDRR